MKKSNISIDFKPILTDSLQIAWQNRLDGFRISFGENEALSHLTFEEYKAFICKLQKDDTCAAVFAMNANQVIGQVELRLDPKREGWVYFCYLAPEFRGQRLAHYLDKYAVQTFHTKGITKAGLRVALTNKPARCFYEKQGWGADGLEPKDDRLMIYRRTFTEST